MRILITGASGGIGRAAVGKFLKAGHEVVGLDLLPSPIKDAHYTHVIADVCNKLPELGVFDVLVNNAGVQDSGKDIEVNLMGAMNVTEKYGVHEHIKSVVFVASASASTGAEFPAYCASKGGLVTYMKNVALRIAPFGGTANSLSPGGVKTALNDRVMNSPEKWEKIMAETPLKKWAEAEEIAEWIYFLAIVNRSMTAQDVVVDNGESARANFIW